VCKRVGYRYLRGGEKTVEEAVVEKVAVLGQHIVHRGAGGEAAQQAVPGRLHHLNTCQ